MRFECHRCGNIFREEEGISVCLYWGPATAMLSLCIDCYARERGTKIQKNFWTGDDETVPDNKEYLKLKNKLEKKAKSK